MTALLFRILALSLAITPIILLLWLLARCFGARFSAACRYRVWGVVMLSLCICTCLVSVPTVYTLYLPQDAEAAETELLDDEAVSSADTVEGTWEEIAISSGTVDVMQTEEKGETNPFAPTETEPFYSVTIQYYADNSKLVKSHVYTYYMKQHVLGDGSDASKVEWAFIDYEVVTQAKYEPYAYSL